MKQQIQQFGSQCCQSNKKETQLFITFFKHNMAQYTINRRAHCQFIISQRLMIRNIFATVRSVS